MDVPLSSFLQEIDYSTVSALQWHRETILELHMTQYSLGMQPRPSTIRITSNSGLETW